MSKLKLKGVLAVCGVWGFIISAAIYPVIIVIAAGILGTIFISCGVYMLVVGEDE